MATLAGVEEDLSILEKEFSQTEKKHEAYLTLLRELTAAQASNTKAVKHLNYLSAQLKTDLKRVENSKVHPEPEDEEKIGKLRDRITEIKVKLDEMKAELPAESNGLYLSIILGGNLNVSLLNSDDRYRYKQDYEKFKMTVTYIAMALLTLAYFLPFRATDALAIFLMVWYYCTLTIREAILRVNGSRIKGWWVIHHYAACVLCGIALTWKDGACYKDFRLLFIGVAFYISVVQVMQYKYQTGCLRRLHALGQRHAMDVTVEGFSSWMFKGLNFLLPFLVTGYLIQGYCSYYLFNMYFFKDCSDEWQVLALAILFGAVSLGNIITILLVFLRKLGQQRPDLNLRAFKYRPKAE